MHAFQFGWMRAMTNRASLTIGLVGSRAYEMQAWRSPGYIALEQAVWAPPTSASPVEITPPAKFWRMQPFRAVAAVGTIIATLVRSMMAASLKRMRGTGPKGEMPSL